MKLNMEEIQIGLFNYVDNEIGKKAVGIQKFATYFALFAFKDKVGQIILGMKENPIIRQLGVFDKDNNVDVDILYNYSKEAIKHSGQFTIMNVIFNESDIDKLYEYLKNVKQHI